ncbi:MAG TPA: OmpW family outer membrane protein [Rariglobus sp.]
MKSRRSASALLALLLAPAALLPIHAASPWSVRLAAAYLQTMDGSTNKAVDVDIEDKLIPEFDVSYAFNRHWSADLVLTVPQEHHVKVNGSQAGTFKHLPPTLLAKYSFDPIGNFTPYLGAGVNFTLIFDDELGAAKLDNYSVGPAAQAGFDYKLNERWALNADVKKMVLRTDVTAGGTKLTEARLDPWLYSVGLRYQF